MELQANWNENRWVLVLSFVDVPHIYAVPVKRRWWHPQTRHFDRQVKYCSTRCTSESDEDPPDVFFWVGLFFYQLKVCWIKKLFVCKHMEQVSIFTWKVEPSPLPAFSAERQVPVVFEAPPTTSTKLCAKRLLGAAWFWSFPNTDHTWAQLFTKLMDCFSAMPEGCKDKQVR